MLWALLLAGGGFLIAGPVGAIIGLLIGVVVAVVSNGNTSRRLERQIKALHQGGDQASSAPVETTFWTPMNIVLVILVGIIGLIATGLEKEGAETATPAVASAPNGADVPFTPVDTAADAGADETATFIPRDNPPDDGAYSDAEIVAQASAAAERSGREADAAAQAADAAYSATQRAAGSAQLAQPTSGRPSEKGSLSERDIDELRGYAFWLGSAIACDQDVTEQSRRVGAWLDRVAPPGTPDQRKYLPMFTETLRSRAIYQRSGASRYSCSEVRDAVAQDRWP